MPLGVQTLHDVVASVGGKDKDRYELIVNMMAQAAPVAADSVWTEANQGLTHRTKIRVGGPKSIWRRLYKGTPPSKAAYTYVSESCGLATSMSEIDVREYDAVGNKAMHRAQETLAHMEELGLKLEEHFFYGSEQTQPESFTGLAPRYSDLSAPNGKNIIDAGGTGVTNTSIWLVLWGKRTLHMFYPKNVGTAGILHEPKDDVYVTDADGNRFKADVDEFTLRPGLALVDWRYVVRIANIDVTTFRTAGAPDLLDLMSQAVWKLPTANRKQTAIEGLNDPEMRGMLGSKPVWYCNRDVAQELERQALAHDKVQLERKDVETMEPVLTYKGIPIHVSDSLLSTEPQVT